jgi:hypothetical protein
VLDGFDRLLELSRHHVEPLERPALELLEVVLVVDADALRHQPTFPVT